LKLSDLLSKYQSEKTKQFLKLYDEQKQIGIKGLSGSSLALYMAATFQQRKGFHLLVMPDKETAAYLYNDLENLLEDVGVDYPRKKVMFYPSAYKRPY
jgi:transcription-repair coupling factor (superfamily II helicase)